jgi:Cu(I)/Ag(I) efflux system membrane fusion protein/cobalt-zinc-cadmium efflux system membrane fusion protein
MNAAKHVLTTSLIWAALLAGVLFFFLRHPSVHVLPASGPPPPIAVAPAASSGTSANTPMHPMEPPLSPVQLTPEQMKSIGVTTGTAEFKEISDDLRATGNVTVNERLVSNVQVRFSGYIRKVFVDATYQYVKKGEPLFTIYSPDLVTTEREYILASDNQRALSRSTIRDVAAGARSLSTAAERRLEQWEIPEDQIAELKRTGKVITDLTIQSPASGYVTERNAFPNMYAEPATRLYTITDLSRVWVNAQVFQSDVGRLKLGEKAAIAVDAYPQKIFSGHVEQVLPQVDTTTRTVPVRLLVENAGLLLKPGMFVNVELKSSLGRRLVVPAKSIFQTGLKQIVFLSKGDGRIEPKEVVLGPQAGDDVVVIKGLEAHQTIVTSANFLIDSESQLQAASGTGAQSPQSPGVGTGNAPGKPVQIEFTSNPDPPHMGTNKLHVKLAGPDAAAVSGVEVAVTYFMPAMPSMGMAAMSASANLAEIGGGVYEGTAVLSMGGTWQVTVTAKQHGQIIATKKFSVNAKGGM